MTTVTSACVLLFHHTSGLVLVERHADGFGLPGGRREPHDVDPLDTARRELLEETGARLISAASILVYEAGPHVCEAFLAVDYADIPLSEIECRARGCAWVDGSVLVTRSARFPDYCARMFARLATHRSRPWPTEVRRCS